MKQEAVPETKLENLYLKFFKYAIVGLMTLALLAVVALLPMAAYSYLQTPAPPVPAKEPPQRNITIEDLKKFLIEAEKRRQESEKNGNAPVKKRTNDEAETQRYLEQASALYRCTEEFKKLADQDTDRSSELDIARRNEEARATIERQSEQEFRGPNWVLAMVDFTCSVLKNPEVAKLKKEKLIGLVVGPTMEFHGATWSMLEKEKADFRRAEANRVESEINAETLRVSLAKAKALFMLGTAGALLGFFMLLALYLIFAKIEDNLRLIHEDIKVHKETLAAS
jgi:hypothetical protein